MAAFQEIFEQLPDGVTLHDPDDGSILETNQQFCEMLDYTREELLQLDFEELHPDESPYTSEQAEEHIRRAATEGPQTFEWVDETKQGDPVPVEVHLSQTKIDGDERILAVVRDITERKRQEERFEAFIEHSTDVISVLAPDGTYEYMSPSAKRILGHDPEELLGEVAFEYVHPDDRDRVMGIFAEAVSNPEMDASAEFRFRHGDGTWIWLESIGNNQLDNPAIEGFVVNSRDVTERRESEIELQERTRELQRQNERLDEFASVLSHDLRNPLNVAQGRLELAQEQGEREHFDALENALARIEALIEDTLELARQGRQVSDSELVDLAEVVTASWETVKTDEARLVIDTDRTVKADESRLQQLVENILRNAIEHGGADVTITVGDLSNGFYIEDDGPGIPNDQREQVFRSGYSTDSEGSGFGLAIVKQIAEAHHWDCRVTDGTEDGARFEFTSVEIE
jgi:PAS domain S-box-containing protein